MTRPRKKPKGGPRGAAKRYHVSFSRETYRAIQGGAIRDGLSCRAWIEMVCKDAGVEIDVGDAEWADRVAEAAGI